MQAFGLMNSRIDEICKIAAFNIQDVTLPPTVLFALFS